MNIGIIGDGAISRFVQENLADRGHVVRVLLLRSVKNVLEKTTANHTPHIFSVEDIPMDVDHMIDCAGHTGLAQHGPAILRRGISLTTVSIGALADQLLLDELKEAAEQGKAKLHLASGAIGALDCLQAARVGKIGQVTYIGRKPPHGWKGSPAENEMDLDKISDSTVHFDGTARDAALAYPKNANVAAAVAFAGTGFEATRVKLIADPSISENIHEIHASGDFGSFSFQISGRTLPDNPRSSALAAMSVVSKIEQLEQYIQI